MFVQINNKNVSSMTAGLARLSRGSVNTAARQRAVLHWIDWLGCVAAGSRAPVSGVLRSMNEGLGKGAGVCSLLGPAKDDWHATLLDAGPANIEEMDDMHREAILHPGPVIMPALAGLAREGLTAYQVLNAVVCGYEVMIRIGRALGPRHYFHWHNTATAGAFGAAAACSDALGLRDELFVWSLGNAGTQAAGLWQVRMEPVMSKQLHTAHAAWVGRSAAQMALAGFTGPQFILEGERGFFAAMCPDGQPHMVLREESDWLIHGTSFKPWPSCRHTHGTIDCVLGLRGRGADALEFQDCVVESFGDALNICNNPAPRTRTEAKFSLQYCVAAAARFGALKPEHFDEEFVNDPSLQRMVGRVRLQPAPELDEAYPAHYGARVTITEGGQARTHMVVDSLGDPERPMTTEDVLAKAETLMRYGRVGDARRDAALSAARSLLVADEALLSEPMPPALLQPLF